MGNSEIPRITLNIGIRLPQVRMHSPPRPIKNLVVSKPLNKVDCKKLLGPMTGDYTPLPGKGKTSHWIVSFSGIRLTKCILIILFKWFSSKWFSEGIHLASWGSSSRVNLPSNPSNPFLFQDNPLWPGSWGSQRIPPSPLARFKLSLPTGNPPKWLSTGLVVCRRSAIGDQ